MHRSNLGKRKWFVLLMASGLIFSTVMPAAADEDIVDGDSVPGEAVEADEGSEHETDDEPDEGSENGDEIADEDDAADEDEINEDSDEESAEEHKPGRGNEMRNERAQQQQERRQAMEEARSVSMEEFHQVRLEWKEELRKTVDERETEGDIEGAYEAQEELVQLDLKDKKEYTTLGRLFDEKRGHGGTKVFVNGKHPHFDVPPVVRSGRTLIPLRAVSQSLKADVKWSQQDQKVTVVKEDVTIELYIDESVVYVNGEVVTLDVPATLEKNRTLVPLRFVSETLDAYVDWDQDSGSVIIIDEDDEEVEEDTDDEETEENDEEEADEEDVEDEVEED